MTSISVIATMTIYTYTVKNLLTKLTYHIPCFHQEDQLQEELKD